MPDKSWIGVDLDGTLAYYDGWKGLDHIGLPIPRMLEHVKKWLKKGRNVRIFTARVSPVEGRDAHIARVAIQHWLLQYIGQELPITHEKDRWMVELWDDRAVQVVKNTGVRADGADIT